MAFTTAAHAHGRAQRSLGRQPLPDGSRAAHGHPLANVRRTRARLESLLNIRGLEIGDVVRVPFGPAARSHARRAGRRVPDAGVRAPGALRGQPMAGRRPSPSSTAPGRAPRRAGESAAEGGAPAEGVADHGRIARMRDFDVHRFELDAGAGGTLPTRRLRRPGRCCADGAAAAAAWADREQAALLSGAWPCCGAWRPATSRSGALLA